MKHLAREIISSYENEIGEKLDCLPAEPKYKEIEDHKEAKKVMKDYLETVITEVEKNSNQKTNNTNEIINKANRILKDPKFINQRGTRSLIDEDARVGRKSKTQNFYGYKTEFVMTTDERIITSIKTANGAYVDGSYVTEMLEQTRESGLEIEEVYGDKAYFRKPILNEIEKMNAKGYIPVSKSVYRLDESEYIYNKDSDEWQCGQGNITVNKKYYKNNTKIGTREGK